MCTQPHYAFRTKLKEALNSLYRELIITLLEISYEIRSVVAYACALFISGFSLNMSQSGCPKVPAQAAVQVNIIGKDGSVGPPLFISPQTSQI